MTHLLLITIEAAAAYFTYLVSVQFKQGAVRASAGLSLAVATAFALLPETWFDPVLYSQIPVVFFGASFAGMTSPKKISNPFLIAGSGAVFAVLYLYASTFFKGYGGGLGTAAYISVLTMYSLLLIGKEYSKK